MNDVLDRLRAADPAGAAPDPRGPYARAMLERVLAAEATPAPAPRPSLSRRLLPKLAAAAVLVAAASTLAVVKPWAGDPASAYTLDRHTDGSLTVGIRPYQLDDPAKLNALLAASGARTVVLRMVPADRCPTPPAADPAFEPLPPDATPEQVAASLARMPLRYEMRGEEVAVLVFPWKIPAGETLVIGYTVRRTAEGNTTMVRPAVVTAVPDCLAAPVPRTR